MQRACAGSWRADGQDPHSRFRRPEHAAHRQADPPARRLQRDRPRRRRPGVDRPGRRQGHHPLRLSVLRLRAGAPGAGQADLRARAFPSWASATGCSGWRPTTAASWPPSGRKEYGRARIAIEDRARLFSRVPGALLRFLDEPWGFADARFPTVFESPPARRAAFPPHSPTSRGASGECSSIPRRATASTAWKYWRPSPSTSAAPRREWNMRAFMSSEQAELRRRVGDRHVVLLISGGVDSCVVAALLLRSLDPGPGPPHVRRHRPHARGRVRRGDGEPRRAGGAPRAPDRRLRRGSTRPWPAWRIRSRSGGSSATCS